MSIELPIPLVGEAIALAVLVAALLILGLIQRVTRPSLLLTSRYVRHYEELPPPKPPPQGPGHRQLPMFRIWVQNLDGAHVDNVWLRLRVRGPGSIRAVRANGGGGEWAPVVYPPGRWPPGIRGSEPGIWLVHCAEGMRPHATWRVEANAQGASAIAVDMLRESACFGTARGIHRIGPSVTPHVFFLLVSLGMGSSWVGWAFLGAAMLSPVLFLVSMGIVCTWALVLLALVRPVQAGVMTGWAGPGEGWYLEENDEPRRAP